MTSLISKTEQELMNIESDITSAQISLQDLRNDRATTKADILDCQRLIIDLNRKHKAMSRFR